MEKKVKFTSLKYIPLSGNGEAINTAIILHDYVNGKLYFDKIKRHKRIQSFDDTLNLEVFKDTLEQIEYFIKKPFSQNLIDNKSNRYNPNYLIDISNMFLNEHRMGDIIPVYCDNVSQQFDELRSAFLYFDIEKENRPNKNDAIKTINTIYRSAKRDFQDLSIEKDFSLDSNYTHGENIVFDYKIGDSYYKVIDLSADKYALKFMSVKSWIYNAKYLSKDENLKFILVNENDSSEAQIIHEILKQEDKNIHVINSEGFIKDIKEEQRNRPQGILS